MSIQYFLHDGGQYVVPHYAGETDLHTMIDLCRNAAVEEMKEARAAHAVYAEKRYHQGTHLLREVDLYCPAVLLDDAEFQRRTDDEYKDDPGCYILAAHAKT